MSATWDRRREWARSLLARSTGPVPAYGSDEWLALPDACAEKVAAVVMAAELSIYAERVTQVEVAATAEWFDHVRYREVEGEMQARDQYHRAMWTGFGFRPDPAIEADIEREWWEWVQAS